MVNSVVALICGRRKKLMKIAQRRRQDMLREKVARVVLIGW